jgi:hypothetical protein
VGAEFGSSQPGFLARGFSSGVVCLVSSRGRARLGGGAAAGTPAGGDDARRLRPGVGFMLCVCKHCARVFDTDDYPEKLLKRGWSGERPHVEVYATTHVRSDGVAGSSTVYHRLRWNVRGYHGHKTGSICVFS